MNRESTSQKLVPEQLVVRKSGRIGYLGLNQPEKHNAISYEMWTGLVEIIDDFESDDDIHLIIIYGEGGKAFSSGADISQFEQARACPETIRIYDGAAERAQEKLATMSKPTIAKITGYCIGGGLATALCCDLRFATHDSKFGIPAAKLGLGYGYSGLKPLVQLVGPTHAKEIMFTARQFSAAEAYEMGLINQALTRRELNRFVYEYTETIANNAPLTIRACKRIINEIGKETGNRDLSLCERLVSDCFASQDYKEGRRAFMQKRAPRFLGK